MGTEYSRVLIPTDFSPWAEAAVERCPEIRGVEEVVLLHVTLPRERQAHGDGGGGEDPETARIRSRLEEAGRSLKEAGLKVTFRVEDSPGQGIARTILKVAEETGSGLILIGARGAGGLREALLGSVSHDVLRGAKQHVLLMHPRPAPQEPGGSNPACPLLFSTVLCPVDLSRTMEETIHSIRQFDGRSRLILLHAVPPAEPDARHDLLLKRATERLEALQQEIAGYGGSAAIVIRAGDPVSLTVAEAERAGASLVLLSRYGRFDYMKNIPIGGTAESIALKSTRPVLVRFPRIPLSVVVRELSQDEFSLAEQVWVQYHRQKADRDTDSIFAVFVEGVIAGVARCRRHPDGYEVDGVFVLPEFRDRGYARRVMQELIRECGHRRLFMHGTLELVAFYKTFGFVPIPEEDLPQSIRERFSFAGGNMEGSDVCPMRREPGQQRPA